MSTAADTGLCEFCRELKPVAWVDQVGREFCAGCLTDLTVLTGPTLVDYLMATIPFKVGDRVRCYTAGALFDGIGTIDEVSTELDKFGTPIFPSFHVVIDEPAYPEAPDSLYYMERQLKLADSS